MRSSEWDFISKLRKLPAKVRTLLAKTAVFFFLLTVSPAVFAMSQIERRELNRTPIVQMAALRKRRRALDRHYGYAEPQYVYA